MKGFCSDRAAIDLVELRGGLSARLGYLLGQVDAVEDARNDLEERFTMRLDGEDKDQGPVFARRLTDSREMITLLVLLQLRRV